MIVKLYRRLAAQARTINKFNRTRIAVENLLTPLELQDLAAASLDELGADLPMGRAPGSDLTDRALEVQDRMTRHFSDEDRLARQKRRASFVKHSDWCENLSTMCAQSNKLEPEPFVRRRLSANMLFYSSGGDTRHKTLAFCFTSAARRMMIPLPAFLQSVDASQVDIVLLCDPSKNLYRDGINGIAGDMPSLFELLDRQIDRHAYHNAVAIGTSAGGLPAVLAALRLGLDSVLCVAGSDPNDSRFTEIGGVGATALMQQYAANLKKPLPEIFALYSADYETDETAAKAIAATLSAVATAPALLAFEPRNETPIGHNLLPAILKEGELPGLLKTTVFR